MAEFPALPLFTDAFIGDTTHLSAAQTGAYIMLLIVAWRMADCALPDDDGKLQRWSRMNKREWLHHKQEIMAFWVLGEDKKWRQGRLTDEHTFVTAKSKSQSRIAKIRWLKNNNSRDANASVRQSHGNAPTPTYSKKVSKKDTNVSQKGSRFNLDHCPNEWVSFLNSERPDLETKIVFDTFRDYWIAKTGNAATKLDWFATWRNWVRNQKQQPKGNENAKRSKWDIAAETAAKRKMDDDTPLLGYVGEGTEKLR